MSKFLTKDEVIEKFNKKIGFNLSDIIDLFIPIVDEYNGCDISVYGKFPDSKTSPIDRFNRMKYELLFDIVDDRVELTGNVITSDIDNMTNVFFSVYVPSPKDDEVILDIMEKLKVKFNIYGYVFHSNFYSEFKFEPKIMYK